MQIENHRYLYFDSRGGIKYYLNNLDELKEFYYEILNKKYLEGYKDSADLEFHNNMEDDGYLIVALTEFYFFIDLNKIDNIYRDIDDTEIISILNSNIN